MWKDDIFYYSVRMLKKIATNYSTLDQGLEFRSGQLIVNPWSLAEYKADFDMAFQSIGKDWSGQIGSHKFSDYHYLSKLQQVVLADILGIMDYELESLGFFNIPGLRGYAYYRMVKFLNEGKQ